LAAVSSHPKRTLSFRPLMSRTSFSRSVDMGVTSSREHEISSPGVAPAIAWLGCLGKWSGTWRSRAPCRSDRRAYLENGEPRPEVRNNF
jgi:hypothetical protein